MEKQVFTAAEVELIKKYWVTPPEGCTGKCDVVDGCLVSWCNGCGWDGMGMDY